MKNFGLTLLISLMFFACTKETSLSPDLTVGPLAQGGVTRGSSEGVFSATIDGVLFEADAIRGEVDQFGFSIEAFKPDGKVYLSTFGTTTGEYVSATNVFNEILYDPDTTNASHFSTFFQGNSSDGKINIISYNKSNNTISGTFEGQVESLMGDIITITKGSFGNVTVLPPNIGSMNATIGSDMFSASPCSYARTFVGSDYLERITAQAPDSAYRITLAFPDDIELGTHELDTASIYCVVEDKDGNLYNSNQGEVTISRTNRLLNEFEGSFEFIAIDTSTLTILNIKQGDFFAVE